MPKRKSLTPSAAKGTQSLFRCGFTANVAAEDCEVNFKDSSLKELEVEGETVSKNQKLDYGDACVDGCIPDVPAHEIPGVSGDRRSTGASTCGILSSSTGTYFIQLVKKQQICSDDEKFYFLTQHWRPSSDYKFPTKQIHNKNRKFQMQWLQNFHWLVYSPSEDGAFCKYCVCFSHGDNLGRFVRTPCTNWNKASDQIKDHCRLKYHQDATQLAEEFLNRMKNPELKIVNQLDLEAAKNIATNRQVLHSLFKIVEVCGRQGLALRGNCDDGVLQVTNRSNFNALLKLCVDVGDEVLKKHLDTCNKRVTYVSKTTQNRLIDLLGQQIQDKILSEVKSAKYFTILADELTDSANSEQLSIVLSFVDANLDIREEFLAFVPCSDIRGETLAATIIECLTSWGLTVEDIRGQGYDGAANMAGKFKGLQARILQQNNKVLYFHCASHCLSLCVVKACNVLAVKNVMATLKEISLFFSLSPKRQRKLEEVIEAAQSDSKKKKAC